MSSAIFVPSPTSFWITPVLEQEVGAKFPAIASAVPALSNHGRYDLAQLKVNFQKLLTRFIDW